MRKQQRQRRTEVSANLIGRPRVMSQTSNVEWLVRLLGAGVAGVDTVGVYCTESALDANGEPSGIKRLWVAARGDEEGGNVGAFRSGASHASFLIRLASSS
jgi:hypothetical protein